MANSASSRPDGTAPDNARAAPGPFGRLLGKASFTARVLIVAIILVLALLLWQWRHALLLAFASILIACGLSGLGDAIRRILPIGRGWTVGLALLLVLGALLGVGFLFGSQIAGQLDTLARTLPSAVERLRDQIAQTELGQRAITQLQSDVGSNGMFVGIAGRIGSFGISFASAALDLLVVVVAGVFLALEPRLYRKGLLLLAPSSLRKDGRAALDHSGLVLRKWLVATMFSMAAMALMVTAGLWALGVPAPLALGLVAGLAQFVPFVGPIVSAAPGILLAFTVSPTTAVLATLLYVAASTIEADILYPLIQKKAVEQPPVITLYAIIAFGLLFGPLGVLLAVPMTLVATVFIVIFYVRGILHHNVGLPGE